jgi:hypothetical protein
MNSDGEPMSDAGSEEDDSDADQGTSKKRKRGGGGGGGAFNALNDLSPELQDLVQETQVRPYFILSPLLNDLGNGVCHSRLFRLIRSCQRSFVFADWLPPSLLPTAFSTSDGEANLGVRQGTRSSRP